MTVYLKKRFNRNSRVWIDGANEVVDEYREEGITLTLRQLFYQLVIRGYAESSERIYANMSRTFADARLTGEMRWDAMEDATRYLRTNPHAMRSESAMEEMIAGLAIDKWADQKQRVEVWVEKDSMLGTIAPMCEQWDVPYFSSRGFPSATELQRAGMRLRQYREGGQDVRILHLADHDPSGMDITRDVQERMQVYVPEGVEVLRVGLNKAQVDEFGVPPNPTKLGDSRSAEYVTQFGEESWEIDALDPVRVRSLCEEAITDFIDMKKFKAACEVERGLRSEVQRRLQGLNLPSQAKAA